MLITRRSQDPKRGDIKAATPPTQTLDKTVHAIRNQIAKWNSRRHSRVISKSDISPETLAGQAETQDSQPSCSGAISRLPVEIIEEIITSVGYDIPLIPHQLDRLRSPRQFHAYFELVEDKVRDRNKVIRNLRLVSRLWNQLATTHADRYIVIRMGVTNFQELLNSKSDPLQVRHVWILPLALQDGVDPTIFSGLRPIALIFGRFRNLETFYCRSYDCYEMFGSEHIREIGVPPKLRVWGIEGPCLRDWVHGVLQTKILRLFPQLETLVQVGLCTEGNWNPMLDNPCSITMVFDRSQNSDVYFSKFQSLSLAGGPLLQDDTIVALANLCPPIRSLCICGFDRNFTMKGPPRPENTNCRLRSIIRTCRTRLGITPPSHPSKRTTMGSRYTPSLSSRRTNLSEPTLSLYRGRRFVQSSCEKYELLSRVI